MISIEEAIKKPQLIQLEQKPHKMYCYITDQQGQKFTLYIDKDNIAQFHPSAL